MEEGGAQPKEFPWCNPCGASVPFGGALMSKFLLSTRGAGLGQGALPVAVSEYFQNRALTFLKESVSSAAPSSSVLGRLETHFYFKSDGSRDACLQHCILVA